MKLKSFFVGKKLSTSSFCPEVGYATALDVFIIICFVSVFTALIEFSFINFIDMFIRPGSRLLYLVTSMGC